MNFPGNPPASNSSASQAGPRSYQSSPVAPTGPSSSTSSNSRNSRLEHIIQNYYTKTAQVIVQARLDFEKDQNVRRSSSSIASSSDKAKNKLNKWFNIATQDAEGLKEDLKFWRSRVLQSIDEEIPPLVLEIYLDISELTPTQSLTIADDRSRYCKVDLHYPVDRVLLERWTLSLNHPLPDSSADLPSLYKRSIISFRSLYSFVRLLPAYELQRRLRQVGAPNGMTLGYRMTPIATYDESEVPLDKSILDGDARDLQAYGFSDVVTPLGTFRLQVLYRKNCDFRIEDSSERDLSARMLDLNEHFFTPTMDQHRLEQRPRSVYSFEDQEERGQRESPRFSSSFGPRRPSFGSSDPREILQQRQRQSSLGIRGSPTSGSPSSRDSLITRAAQPSPVDTTSTPPWSTGSTTTPAKRLSAPHTSPFKSPSLSSSPQAELMFADPRPQPSVSEKSHSGSTGGMESGSISSRSRIEFSPSFDKLRERGSPSRGDVTRRWSRASDHSSINFVSDTDDTGLEEFMRLASATPELKMFQNRTGTSQMIESTSMSPTSETSSSMGASGYGSGSIYRSKKTLSHFRSLRDAHSNLSESMTSSVLARSGGERPETSTSNVGLSLGSSSSSTGRSYLPVVPSPLHPDNQQQQQQQQSAVNIPRSYHRNSEPFVQIHRQHQRHHSSSQNKSSDPGNSGSPHSPLEQHAFSSYPKSRHHDELRRLCITEDNMTRQSQQQQQVQQQQQQERRLSIGDALPSPTDIQRQESSVNFREMAGGEAFLQTGHRMSLVDDDDSLVFRMSELGTEGSSSSSIQQQHRSGGGNNTSVDDSMPFARPLTEVAYNTRDYARRLGLSTTIATDAPSPRAGNTSTGSNSNSNLQRIGSATSIAKNSMATVVEEEEKSASTSSSKSESRSRPHLYDWQG